MPLVYATLGGYCFAQRFIAASFPRYHADARESVYCTRQTDRSIIEQELAMPFAIRIHQTGGPEVLHW